MVCDVWRLLRRRVFEFVSPCCATSSAGLYSCYYCCVTTIFAVHRCFGRFSCRGCCRTVPYVDDWLHVYRYFYKSYYQFRSVFAFIVHNYIIRLSSSTSCLPPCQCLQSLPVLRFQSASMPAPEALTSDTAASASSSTPVLPASYFVRDSEQITASEALLVLQEGPRASHPCWLKLSQRPKTSPRLRISLRLRISHKTLRSLYHLELRRPTLYHTLD